MILNQTAKIYSLLPENCKFLVYSIISLIEVAKDYNVIALVKDAVLYLKLCWVLLEQAKKISSEIPKQSDLELFPVRNVYRQLSNPSQTLQNINQMLINVQTLAKNILDKSRPIANIGNTKKKEFIWQIEWLSIQLVAEDIKKELSESSVQDYASYGTSYILQRILFEKGAATLANFFSEGAYYFRKIILDIKEAIDFKQRFLS